MTSPEQNTPVVKFEWQWNWKVLAFTLFFLPITVTAGFWQLHRAEEKREILAAQSALQDNAPIEFSNVVGSKELIGANSKPESGRPRVAERYLRVVVNGEIHSQQVFLMDNRVRNGRLGYEVLIPVKMVVKGEEPFWLIVNRGWLAGGIDRSQLPVIPPLEEVSIFTGYLYKPFGKHLVLAEDVWPAGVSPLVIQHFDHDKFERYLGGKVFPYSLRLEESTNNALKTDWIIINVQPEKHTAYAVQWFAMSLALIVLTLFANSNVGSYFARSSRNDTGE